MEGLKFKLVVEIDNGGTINITSEGICHHVYLLGVLESIKHDILNAAGDMSSAYSASTEDSEEKGEETNG